MIADSVPDFPGPLAGILAGLDWAAANRPGAAFVLTAASDCPFLPRDLVRRLHEARIEGNAQIAVAASGGQSHHVTGLWAVGLREELRHALTVEGVRKVESWMSRYNTVTATWPIEPFDPSSMPTRRMISRRRNGWQRWMRRRPPGFEHG